MGDVWCCRVRKFSVLNGENKRPAGSARVVDPGSVTGMKGGEEVGEGGEFLEGNVGSFYSFSGFFFRVAGGFIGCGCSDRCISIWFDTRVFSAGANMFLDQTINNSGERMFFWSRWFFFFFGILVVGKWCFDFLPLDWSC